MISSSVPGFRIGDGCSALGSLNKMSEGGAMIRAPGSK